MDTGKVLDVEVLTKACKQCKQHEDDEDTPENIAWQTDHRSRCKANFQGSAPAMEPEGELRIFRRSIECNKLRYTEYFGDGDSKSHIAVEDVYNNDITEITVMKKECVGHVQERVKEKKGMGGKGTLAHVMTDKLQNYYGIAIRNNPENLAASLFHCASSTNNNWHQYCRPEGESSCMVRFQD